MPANESTTALNNTIADRRQCHIGNGHDIPDTGDPLILRMQEIEPPHTHWFSAQTGGGQALLADFHAAHGTAEDYGPIPAAMIDKSDPRLMARFTFERRAHRLRFTIFATGKKGKPFTIATTAAPPPSQ
jgi:hypothetical protein